MIGLVLLAGGLSDARILSSFGGQMIRNALIFLLLGVCAIPAVAADNQETGVTKEAQIRQLLEITGTKKRLESMVP